MPLRQKIGKSFFAILAAIFLVTTDQLSKYIIRTSGGLYICNEGIAFGINLPNWAILGLIITIILFISLAILNSNFKFPPCGISLEQKISNFPLILILSGAFSNLFDRISYGCVIDFIDLKIWPIFNLADIFICAGAFLLILQSTGLAKKS